MKKYGGPKPDELDRLTAQLAAAPGRVALTEQQPAAPQEVVIYEDPDYQEWMRRGGRPGEQRARAQAASEHSDKALLRAITSAAYTPSPPPGRNPRAIASGRGSGDARRAETGGRDRHTRPPTETKGFKRLYETRRAKATLIGGLTLAVVMSTLGIKAVKVWGEGAPMAAQDNISVDHSPVPNTSIIPVKGLTAAKAAVTNGHVDMELPAKRIDKTTQQELPDSYIHLEAFMADGLTVAMKPNYGNNNSPMALATYDSKHKKWTINRASVSESYAYDVLPKTVPATYGATDLNTQAMTWWQNAQDPPMTYIEGKVGTEEEAKATDWAAGELARIIVLLSQLSGKTKDAKGHAVPVNKDIQPAALAKLQDIELLAFDAKASAQLQKVQDDLLKAAVAKKRHISPNNIVMTGNYGKLAPLWENNPTVKRLLGIGTIALNQKNYLANAQFTVTPIKATPAPTKGAK